jgi:hypothetical protein
MPREALFAHTLAIFRITSALLLAATVLGTLFVLASFALIM